MKATGIVRRIDDLGRVVIPKEIRRTMRICEGEPLGIHTDQEDFWRCRSIQSSHGFSCRGDPCGRPQGLLIPLAFREGAKALPYEVDYSYSLTNGEK